MSATERLIAEQTVMNLLALNTACHAAAVGKAVSLAETFAMYQKRELIRQKVKDTLQQQARRS